ncbi:MAG: hypothetical protein ACK4K3_07545 [Aquabacterium sp.]
MAAARKTRTTSKSQLEVGIKHGFRSGLEGAISRQLTAANVPFEYEAHKVEYVTPATPHKYTPDFLLPNGIFVETKGRFVTADRQKHLLIKAQHPELDIRFVFSNSKQRISKTSKTTYADWCDKHGFAYADKLIPQDWLKEQPIKTKTKP